MLKLKSFPDFSPGNFGYVQGFNTAQGQRSNIAIKKFRLMLSFYV